LTAYLSLIQRLRALC